MSLIERNEPTLQLSYVRITPETLEFIDPFEGSTYKKKISIQNISNSTVFIKIGQPKSYTFRIKGTCRNEYLSPGLSIVKNVSLTYTHMSPHSTVLPIYINSELYNYEMRVILPTPIVKIEPKCIDFGSLDAGFTSAVRSLRLRNDGSKATRFNIDVGRDDPLLIMEPNKGVLQPRSSIEIKLRLVAFKEGTLMPEFWIICDTPIRVPLKGTVISPKFEAFHPNCAGKFTLINFPTTYYGAQSVQALVMRNYSSHRAMFCVMGEVDRERMSLQAAEEHDNTFKHFDVFPKDGRLEPKETRIIYFTFRPEKPRGKTVLADFSMCSFQICRVPCKDLDPNDYTGPIFTNDRGSFSPQSRKISAASLITSLNVSVDYDMTSILSEASLYSEQLIYSEESKSVITVYVHAMAKLAAVNVTPDEFTITNLRIGEKVRRVLRLANASNKLPIILRYRKVTYIDLERKNIFLKPSEQIEVSVIITPHAIGNVKTHIKFDLMFYNDPSINDDYRIVGHLTVPIFIDVVAEVKRPTPKFNTGIAPNYIKEVGMFCEGIKFNDNSAEKPKAAMLDAKSNKDDDIIAFPNDTQMSIRPWRSSNLCKTIFTGIPRYAAPTDDDYELADFDAAFKKVVTGYYTEYTRKEAERLRQLTEKSTRQVPDYMLTDENLLLFTNHPCGRQLQVQHKINEPDPYFLPLTISQLNQIIIYPKIITTGQIAAHHAYGFNVKVNNTTSCAIRLFIRTDKPSLLFPDGERRIVKANTEVDVPLTYLSPSYGFYTLTIDFIVNQCNVYVITLLADVVQKSLRLSTHLIEFNNDDFHKYVEIYNPLNASISFYWNVEHTGLLIDPLQGIVEAKRHLTCYISYSTHHPGSSFSEIEFTSGERNSQLVKVITNLNKMHYSFVNNVIKFNNIPLNIAVTRKAVLRNSGTAPILFKILNPELIDGVSIEPASAVIKGNSEWILYVTAKLRSCVKFSCTATFDITRCNPIDLFIEGNVVYPEINILPKQMQLKKIPASAADFAKFIVHNKSAAIATVYVDLSDYHEFEISESRQFCKPYLREEFTLEANASKELYLHFNPSDVSSGTFYLPVIINDILGPPINTDIITTKVDYYLRNYIVNCVPVNIPSMLKGTSVLRRTTQPKVKLSKTLIELTYDSWNREARSSYDLTITNPQKESDEICIRTDQLADNFGLEPIHGQPTVLYEYSIVFSLNAKENVVLKASFLADHPGEFEAILPVYMRSDMSDNPHNYICLRGTYYEPTIVCESAPVYFKPRHVKITTTGCIPLKFEGHREDCVLHASTDVIGLELLIPDEYSDKNKEGATFEIKVKTTYTPQKGEVIDSAVIFTCTCGVLCEVPIQGVSENCSLTNHAFVQTFMGQDLTQKYNLRRIKSIESGIVQSVVSVDLNTLLLSEKVSLTDFFNTYPSYPTESTAFYHYMNTVLYVAESWVYSQGFFGTHYYNIPEGINLLPEPVHNVRKSELWIMPFAQLLINLAGKEMINYLQLAPAPRTHTERVSYCYAVYQRCLIFLQELGALMPHVRPELLLDYSFYMHWIQKIKECDKAVADKSVFYLLSKQAWLDLVLQTHKVLVLCRVELETETNSIKEKCLENLTPAQVFSQTRMSKFDINKSKTEFVFSEKELMLLEWLEFSYDLMKKTVWSNYDCMETKPINTFDHNLDDGLVFIAVTAIYCPYMRYQFSNIYTSPTTYEENLHNAIKITQCWDMLNLSLPVVPQDIVKSNPVHMLILAAYLFEVLRNLTPTETIEFKACLSQSTTKAFKLKNNNDFKIAYKIIFFNNDNECFSTDNHKVVIAPWKSVKIAIKYNAHFLKHSAATMVLSGECAGFHYCKSKALTLIGEPDVTFMTSILTIPAYLYKPSEITWTCKSPYNAAGTYSLKMFFSEPKDVDEILHDQDTDDKLYVPIKRFHPYKEEHTFNVEGIGEVEGIIVALIPMDRTIWCYFRNTDIGDFAIQINAVIRFPKLHQQLDIMLPKNFRESRNLCKDESVTVKIPYQNQILWDALKTVILRMKTGVELEFWKTHIHDISGMRLLHRFLAEDKLCAGLCLSKLFGRNTRYAVKMPRKCQVSLPDMIMIENECAPGYLEVQLGFEKFEGLPQNFAFSLEAEDGPQFRYYMTNFILEE